MSDPADNADDELRRFMQEFLSGNGDIDPAKLAGAAGLPMDAASIQQMMAGLRQAMQGDGGVNWKVAEEQARALAKAESVSLTDRDKSAIDSAFQVAGLWLSEATEISELTVPGTALSRSRWVKLTMPVWAQLTEPVALSISNALANVLREQAPEFMQDNDSGMGKVMQNIGGTLFAMQLGQVVGKLSGEVVSGGDIGVPLLPDETSALLPQNIDAFGDGLDIPTDQIQLYLAVRELAHARLFKHAKWLRLQVISSITEIAGDIQIDVERLEEIAENFDPTNPEELRAALEDGRLIPAKTDNQLVALGRLETVLALIEGWVEVVTENATSRLPKSVALAETVRRRRATGGPAEHAFATLIGLELRPRRLREAAQMWRQIGTAVGSEKRDSLWSQPDLLPSSADIDDPTSLIARLSGNGAEPDELDRDLEDLLGSS